MAQTDNKRLYRTQYTVTQTYEAFVGADSKLEARALLKDQISNKEVKPDSLEIIGSTALFNEIELYAIGDDVVHRHHGAGVVMDYEGIGNDARVQIQFKNNDEPTWLLFSEAFLVAR